MLAGNDVFKEDGFEKKEENVLESLFTKKRREKEDLNYLLYCLGGVCREGKQAEVVRLYLNSERRGEGFEVRFLKSFFAQARVDYQIVSTRAQSLMNCTRDSPQISSRSWSSTQKYTGPTISSRRCSARWCRRATFSTKATTACST